MAYGGCNGKARWIEEFKSYLPMPVFGSVVAGIRLPASKAAAEHRESVRKLLGWLSCSVFAGIGRSTVSLELAGGDAIGRRRLSGF